MLVYFEWLTHTALFENVTRADGNPFNGESYVRGLKFYSAMGEDDDEDRLMLMARDQRRAQLDSAGQVGY